MRSCQLVIWVGVLCCGCGDDHEPGRSHAVRDAGHAERDAGRGGDAGADAESGDAGDHAEAAAILTEFVAEYDRRMRLQCPCIVEAGGYESIDVCLEKLSSGPDWVECLAQAAASQDTPELRATARCFVDQTKARNDCYDTTACGSDERIACDAIQVACAVFDPQLVVLVSQKCPDTTILATRL